MRALKTSGEHVTVHQHSDFRNTVVVPNVTAQDSSLSWAARGLLVHMLSMPQDWQFREHELVSRSPMGRDHLRSIVRELEAAGYLRRTPRRDARGRTCGTRWEVWARPSGSTVSGTEPSTKTTQSRHSSALATENPSPATPFTERPSTENPTPYKNPNQQNPQSTKNKSISLPTAAGKTPPAAATGTSTMGRGRGKQTVDPAAASLPAGLEPHRAGIVDFWAAKRHGSARTPKAFELLVSELERIHAADPTAVTEQLNAATQAGWSSITFQNWQRYSKGSGGTPQLAYGGHGSRAQQNAAAAIALLNQWEAEGDLFSAGRPPQPALEEGQLWS